MKFISYGDEKFTNSKIRIEKEAKLFGFTDIKIYSPDDLDIEFKTKFSDILKMSRIGGYGIWRPYIIKKSLETLLDGEYLIYLDAGCTININGMERFKEYLKMFETSKHGIISFQMPHLEKFYTTKQIFEYFKCSNDDKIINTGQYLDGILIMRKTPHLVDIINKWLNCVYENPQMFTDQFNNQQEYYFIDNRHEQSVFSVLRKVYGSIVITQDETFDTVVPWGSQQSFKYPFWATRIRG